MGWYYIDTTEDNKSTEYKAHKGGKEDIIMVDFDRLNRQTFEANNYGKDPTSYSNMDKYGTSSYWQNYWNNYTYKVNNGDYRDTYTKYGR